MSKIILSRGPMAVST